MRLSYSSFDSYKNCPLKYKFQAIDKLKEPKKAMQMFGTLLHSVMEYIHKPGFFHPTVEQALELLPQNSMISLPSLKMNLTSERLSLKE